MTAGQAAPAHRTTGPRVAVAVATYRRPAGLQATVDSLQVARGQQPFRLLVVDNDPQGSARDVVVDPALELDYRVEPRPGIAAARNRLLEGLRPDDDCVVFLDDDEVVDPDWLHALVSSWQSSGADVVVGPVLPVLEPGAPAWVRRGGFFDRPRQETGSPVRWPATNNVLISRPALELLAGEHFSEAWSATGGSDSELFARLRRAGARILWCDEAVVSESVPASRASARWLWRRGVRLGNVSARLKQSRVPRAGLVAIGVGRAAYGVLATLAGLLLRGHVQARHAMHVPKGVGMAAAALGRLHQEYRRAA